MLSQFFEYARYLKPVMKLFIAALAAGALAAAASGFGFPLMIAKVFPVVFDNTQIPPELQDMIARLVAPEHMHLAVLLAVCSLLPLVFAVRGIGHVLQRVLDQHRQHESAGGDQAGRLFQIADAAPFLH